MVSLFKPAALSYIENFPILLSPLETSAQVAPDATVLVSLTEASPCAFTSMLSLPEVEVTLSLPTGAMVPMPTLSPIVVSLTTVPSSVQPLLLELGAQDKLPLISLVKTPTAFADGQLYVTLFIFTKLPEELT